MIFFGEPKQLPSVRALNHIIPFILGSKVINIRPCKSSYVHKGEIERLVNEMLQNRIIQHSYNSYASSILLLKKKDNTWRFYIDYRQLNNITIKNKFHIPLFDDLLGEL
jgi:hypothetical protein